MNIKLFRDRFLTDYKSFVFPGGEVGVKLAPTYKTTSRAAIRARICSAKEQVEIAMLKDAVERHYKPDFIDLELTYLPYARQDRVCDIGESFSLKVFAKYINALNFDEVTLFDPHSEVSSALIENVKVIKQLELASTFPELNRVIQSEQYTLVSPDAGANKKTSEIAGYFGHGEFIRADKLRDLSNGKIKETIVYCDDLKGRNIAIFDDLVDGGRTFIELAKVLKAKNCGKVLLYATHGIFSQGVDVLLNGGIDSIYTTNSFKDIEDARVIVKKIF